MEHKSDLYKLIGVSKNATTDQIRKAFMTKAMKYHPDKAPEDKKEDYEKHYTQIQRAYKILINPKSREQYNGTLQNTFSDLRSNKDRDIGYIKNNKYKTVDGEFDNEKFSADFNKSRSSAEILN